MEPWPALYQALNEAFPAIVDARAMFVLLAMLKQWPHLSREEQRHWAALWLARYVMVPERAIVARRCFDFWSLTPQRFAQLFRFQMSNIEHVYTLLRIEETFITEDGHSMHGLDALLLLLRRLVTPQQLFNLEDDFGVGTSSISTVLSQLCLSLFNRFGATLYGINCCWNTDRLHAYAGAIRDRLEFLDQEWPNDVEFPLCGMLDGVFIRTQRPGNIVVGQDLQRAAYSGYYHAHGLRTHHVLFPDGMIGHVARRLIAGRQNDAALFVHSLYLRTLDSERILLASPIVVMTFSPLPLQTKPTPTPPTRTTRSAITHGLWLWTPSTDIQAHINT